MRVDLSVEAPFEWLFEGECTGDAVMEEARLDWFDVGVDIMMNGW
jgi:hypothetical protein